MTTKLFTLYNTLKMVETKGDSTKIMGDCLKYLEQLLQEQQKADEEAAATANSTESDESEKQEA